MATLAVPRLPLFERFGMEAIGTIVAGKERGETRLGMPESRISRS